MKTQRQKLPDPARLLHMRVTVIPHMLKGIDAARQALSLEKQYGILETIKISRSSNEQLVSTVLGGYTQSVISMAAIQCRALLEFLGLTGKRDEKRELKTRPNRKDSDVCIEHYVDSEGKQLTRLTREQARAVVPYPDRTEHAWITVIEFTDQRLAHVTDDRRLGGKSVRPHLYNAFRTVPILVRTTIPGANGVDALLQWVVLCDLSVGKTTKWT